MVNPIDQGYITVADRLAAFVKDYPNGSVRTDLSFASYDASVAVVQTTAKGDMRFTGSGLVVVRSEVRKDATSVEPDGTGLASMAIPGVTNYTRFSEVENTETSATGRALAAIGYLAKNPDGSARISSADEIAMKKEVSTSAVESLPSENAETISDPKMTIKQQGLLFAKAKEAGINVASGPGKGTLQKIARDTVGKGKISELRMSDVDAMFEALDALILVVKASGGTVTA